MKRVAMNRAAAAALLAVGLLLGGGLLRAQTSASVLAGAGVSGTIGSEMAEVPVYGAGPECGRFTSGSSTGGALDGRLVVPSFFGAEIGIDARLRVSVASSRMTTRPVLPTIVRGDDGTSLVTLDREFRLERTTVASTVDLLARLVAGRFALGAGAAVGVRITSTIEQSDNILGPGASAFKGGLTTIPMTGASPQSAALVLTPTIAAGYLLPLGSRTMLMPELTARIDLLSSATEHTWRTLELGIGAAVLFDLTPAPSPISPGGSGK